MIRFSTIGTNFITEKFLEEAFKCDNLKYTAVYSRSKSKASTFAEKYGVERYYTDLNQMAAADDIDAVYIASPNSLHCEQAILMMEHGKHVLCEKPIASNWNELNHMQHTAREKGVVLLEAMKSVFDPGFQAMKDNLCKLGKIRRVSFQYCQYSSRYDKFKRGIIENAFNLQYSNGALMDIGVYCVHPLIKLFGMPETVKADALLLENGIDGAGTILAGYSEMQAELTYSKITNGRIPSQIQGENAVMIVSDIYYIKELEICYNDGHNDKISIQKENIMLYEIQEWLRLINTGSSTEEYNCSSELEMKLTDEARRQVGLIFPADE